MKKGIAVISFALYLAATSGIVINSHYCMKKLVSVKLFDAGMDKCGRCGMKMHNNPGCCHDDTKFLKLVQDQVKIPVTVFEFNSPRTLPVHEGSLLFASLFNVNVARHFHNHSPPLLSEQDRYLQNNVFRI